MITRRNNDRMLLEGLVRKYGKNGVKSAIRQINESIDGDFEIKDGVLVKYHGNGGNVTIPQGVISIGDYAFNICSSLTSVTIPDSVTLIGDWAFSRCTSLTSVTIPDSVTLIGWGAFGGCTNLTSITFGRGVKKIKQSAFIRCDNLTNINIMDIAAWCKISYEGGGESSNRPFYYAQNLYLNGKLVTDLIIPDGVTNISDSAFRGCESLTSVTIPNSVKEIRWFTFEGCSNLANVTIGDSVTKIESYAFANCSNLTSVTMSDKTYVDPAAFKGTKINKNKKKNKSLTPDNINDIVNAAINVFTDWENDEEGWDRPFNAYKELSNNDFTDILDYYNGWNDFYNYLDMDEYEFNKLYDKLSSRYLKRINKEIRSAF